MMRVIVKISGFKCNSSLCKLMKSNGDMYQLDGI